jgi:hypothetical protein
MHCSVRTEPVCSGAAAGVASKCHLVWALAPTAPDALLFTHRARVLWCCCWCSFQVPLGLGLWPLQRLMCCSYALSPYTLVLLWVQLSTAVHGTPPSDVVLPYVCSPGCFPCSKTEPMCSCAGFAGCQSLLITLLPVLQRACAVL